MPLYLRFCWLIKNSFHLRVNQTSWLKRTEVVTILSKVGIQMLINHMTMEDVGVVTSRILDQIYLDVDDNIRRSGVNQTSFQMMINSGAKGTLS